MNSNSFMYICNFENISKHLTLRPPFYSRNDTGQERRVEIEELNDHEEKSKILPLPLLSDYEGKSKGNPSIYLAP
jgi:hypothetical protein